MRLVKSENDFYTSLEKALGEIDPDYWNYPGVIVMGTHGPMEVDEKLEEIKKAREEGIPFLGICFGLQMAVVEYARNVLGLKGANSTEIDLKTPHPVITKLPELRVGIYGVHWPSFGSRMESHWHNYAFNKKYDAEFQKDFYVSYTNDVAEIMQLRDHPFFMLMQFHPEYESSKSKPHPILKEFIEKCKDFSVAGPNL